MTKRPRLMMRRTVSVASLGTADAPANFEDEASAAAAAAAAAAKSRPFTHLIVEASPAPPSEKVGLGILAALEAPSISGTTIIRSMANTHQAPPPPPPPPPPPGQVYDFTRLIGGSSSGGSSRKHQMNADFAMGSCYQAHHHHNHAHDDHYRGIRSATLEFLKACYLCKRDITSRDIYMYRGDRAFCSAECRQEQILSDERMERRQKCSSAALKMGPSNQQTRHVNQRAKVAPASTAAAA